MFEDVSIDGSNIDDAFTDGRIWDQASVRRQHTTVKGYEVASSLVCAEKRLRTPQHPTHLTGRDPLEHPVFGPRSQTRVSGSPRTPNCWVGLQESAVFLQHENVSRKFHVAHFRGCPTLFNKHTFEPDLSVELIYVPPDKAHCCGWAFEAVLSKARFRRIPRNGKSTFTFMSLHCQSTVAKRRSIA